MTAPKRPLSARFAELDQAVQSASVRVREVEASHRSAVAEAERLREEVTEAFAVGDEAKAGKLQARRLKAESDASGPWEERVAGAKRAMQRAEADRVQFVSGNISGLLEEREPEARKAADGVEKAVQALREAHRAWHGVAGEMSALITLAGRAQDMRVPTFPPALEDLVRDARRAGGVEVPSPLPAGPPSISIVPEDDPDSLVRRRLTSDSADAA